MFYGLTKSLLRIVISHKEKQADQELNSRDNQDVMQEINRDHHPLHSFVVNNIYKGKTM